jgi:hypothetical protein
MSFGKRGVPAFSPLAETYSAGTRTSRKGVACNVYFSIGAAAGGDLASYVSTTGPSSAVTPNQRSH